MSRLQQQQDAVDELFDAKNAFYVGNYQQAINEAQSLNSLSPGGMSERSALVVRAHLALGNVKHAELLVRNPAPGTPPPHPALALLIDYLANPDSSDVSKLVAQADQLVANGSDTERELAATVAASLHYYQGDFESALKVLHGAGVRWAATTGGETGVGAGSEARALAAQCLAAMGRGELALRVVKAGDEDGTLAQLAMAWAHLSQGCGGVQEAHYLALEALERVGGEAAGAGALAGAAGGARALWPEAESALLAALVAAPRDPTLLHALAVAAHHAAKPPQLRAQYIAQALQPGAGFTVSHPFSVDLQQRTSEFRRLATHYSPSVAS